MSEPEKKSTAASAATRIADNAVNEKEAAEIAREWRKTGSVRAGFTLRHVTRGGVTGAVVKRAGA
jgi:hypothetical protein